MAKHWITKDLGLFRGTVQLEHFRLMPQFYPVRVLRRSDQPHTLETRGSYALPAHYSFAGETCDTQRFLADTDTVGLLVSHRGQRVHEAYWHGLDASVQWPLWSVGKSFVGTLVGIALADGVISDLDAPIQAYVPKLSGSAYEGASIRSVLQMSSGARWNENYADPESDLRRRAAAVGGGSFDAVAASCVRENEPGTSLRYNTTDTHVLGMLLRAAYRTPLIELLRSKLWQPLGMQHDAFWRIDGERVEDAGAGLHATLGDACRLGELYLNGGRSQGAQIVPEAWVSMATRAQGSHVEPGVLMPISELGYGYHWWLPGQPGEFAAIGVYNQYVYVDTQRSVVVAKFSANRNWGLSYAEPGYRDHEHMALFRALAATAAASSN
ncbi:MAG TPA: serine hydrolase [Polyangiales bacterium]|nr:serine hydrolase [Polyangiales bacterium]